MTDHTAASHSPTSASRKYDSELEDAGLKTLDTAPLPPALPGQDDGLNLPPVSDVQVGAWYSRKRYGGTLLFNLGTFVIPAVYGTLSIIWIAGIDSSLVATGVAYTYAGVIVRCFNEGLPRGVWSVTTNRTTLPIEARLSQILTLITIQTILGLLITIIFIAVAPSFVAAFVPGEVRDVSVQYIRISSGSLVAGMMETAISLGTRALDHPEYVRLVYMSEILIAR